MTDLPPSFAPKNRRPHGSVRRDSAHDAEPPVQPTRSPRSSSSRNARRDDSSTPGRASRQGDLPPSFSPEKKPVRRRIVPQATSTRSSQASGQPAGVGKGPRTYPTTAPVKPTRVMSMSDAQKQSPRPGPASPQRGSTWAPRQPRRRPVEQAPFTPPRYSAPSYQHPANSAPPSAPPQQPAYLPAPEPKRPLFGRRRRRLRPVRWFFVLLLIVALVIGGRVYQLWGDVDSQIGRVDATHAGQSTGETWLIAGSDSRRGTDMDENEVEGERTDSIMILHKAPNGQAALISIPRDTFVDIPDYGEEKINAAFSYGGAPLLVSTVESLTGLHVDHYVQVGMGGVEEMVNAVDGINVCLDYDVYDEDSGLVWDTSQGECQDVDGKKALAYSRMRKSDPTGDIGRGLRQRAVISAVVKKALSPDTLFSLSAQDKLVSAGSHALTIDTGDGVSDLISMVMAFRSASEANLTGAPPIESLDYEPGWIGATVLLRDVTAPDFFAKVRDGSLNPEDFNIIDE